MDCNYSKIDYINLLNKFGFDIDSKCSSDTTIILRRRFYRTTGRSLTDASYLVSYKVKIQFIEHNCIEWSLEGYGVDEKGTNFNILEKVLETARSNNFF